MFYYTVILYVSWQLNRQLSYNLLAVKISYFLQIKLLTVTLLLGGLWGLQSMAWGYFWVNDGIEWTLLIVILLLGGQQHRNEYKKLPTYVSQVLLFLLITLLSLRLNLIPTRHAFLITTPIVYKVLSYYAFFLNYSCLTKSYLTKFNLKIASNLLKLLIVVTVALLVNKSLINLFIKILSISLTLSLWSLVKTISFNLVQFILHYTIFCALYSWLLPYTMFTLLFFTKKNIKKTVTQSYKTLYKLSDVISSKRFLTKILLEKISLYNYTGLTGCFSILWGLDYCLISINFIEVLVLLICLLC